MGVFRIIKRSLHAFFNLFEDRHSQQRINVVPIRELLMAHISFLIWKPAVFCQIKEIKHLREGVVLYAAQANALIDAELVKKSSYRTETKYIAKFRNVTCLRWMTADRKYIKVKLVKMFVLIVAIDREEDQCGVL